MRIALLILLGIHALIHFFGFLKAFELVEFEAIRRPVSRSFGILWLITSLILFCSLILKLNESGSWWLLAIMGAIISQILIFYFWSDAKFGSIANLIILLACIPAYFQQQFHEKLSQERNKIIASTLPLNSESISSDDLKTLPPAIQKWLKASGCLGKKPISSVQLEQSLQLKLKAEDEKWNLGTAEQYFSVEPPAFHWTIKTSMNPYLKVFGRDQYVNGKGQMTIKLLGMITVADARDDPKISQASLQRYLAEMVWFPTAALSPYVEWEHIDQHTARGRMSYKGISGSGVFHFDEAGKFSKFTAQRYMDPSDEEPTEWVVRSTSSGTFDGIEVPVACEASWQMPEGEWTWLKLKIEEVEF